jgi:hypothetical protein
MNVCICPKLLWQYIGVQDQQHQGTIMLSFNSFCSSTLVLWYKKNVVADTCDIKSWVGILHDGFIKVNEEIVNFVEQSEA